MLRNRQTISRETPIAVGFGPGRLPEYRGFSQSFCSPSCPVVYSALLLRESFFAEHGARYSEWNPEHEHLLGSQVHIHESCPASATRRSLVCDAMLSKITQ